MTIENSLTRRRFMQTTAAVAATAMTSSLGWAAPTTKPNSKFNGVQIGVITYSYRSMPSKAEDVLKYVTQCGISSIELMGNVAEGYAGKSIEKYKALRKLYNDAGVNIHIVKFPKIGNNNMSDEQIEFYFKVAKALGAMGITRELSESAAQRLGPIADKHKIWIGFHNHTQLGPDTYDEGMLSYGKYLGINIDIGHYVAGCNHTPIAFIDKYQDRIISMHVKDRQINKGKNMPFGQGDTPIALVLQHMKRNKLTFPVDIELEYKIPQNSDAVQEITRCVEFCKQKLA